MSSQKALNDIARIRQRLQLVDTRRAFRCASITVSAIVFLVAGLACPATMTLLESPIQFVAYWFSVAMFCSLMIGVEVIIRSISKQSRIDISWTRQLATAMAPAATAGVLVTWAVLGSGTFVEVLPGLWSVLAGVGIAASARLLPAICQSSAIWLVAMGALAIRFSVEIVNHASLAMIFLFGGGQLLLAICLFAGVKTHE